MVSHLPPTPPAERPAGAEPQLDDFLELLDQRLMRANLRKRGKLLAWAGVLDAAGWCVALPEAQSGIWLSANARFDLEARGWSPDDPCDLPEILPAGTVSRGGVLVWQGRAGETAPAAFSAGLTNREREVFHWLRAGKCDAEISMILSCAVRTVEKHVANLYRKLGVANRASAILRSDEILPAP